MDIEKLLLQHEVGAFLFEEAALLDDRKFDEWLTLLTDDFRIFAPISRNVRYDQESQSKTLERKDINWFDEGKETVRQRVQQIATGLHWAEEPRSRTVHLLTNIRITGVTPLEAGDQEVTVASAFMVYRHRGQDETDFMVGRRKDILVKSLEVWKIRHREVDLAQTVLLAKNLTTFF